MIFQSHERAGTGIFNLRSTYTMLPILSLSEKAINSIYYPVASEAVSHRVTVKGKKKKNVRPKGISYNLIPVDTIFSLFSFRSRRTPYVYLNSRLEITVLNMYTCPVILVSVFSSCFRHSFHASLLVYNLHVVTSQKRVRGRTCLDHGYTHRLGHTYLHNTYVHNTDWDIHQAVGRSRT